MDTVYVLFTCVINICCGRNVPTGVLAFCGAFDVPRGFAPDYYTISVSLHRKRTLERGRLRYEPTGVDEMMCRYAHKRDYPRISEARSRSLGPERKRTYCMRRTRSL